MYKPVNFKFKSKIEKNFLQAINLHIEVEEIFGEIDYFVYAEYIGIGNYETISPPLKTAKEAFELVEKISKRYPKYGDDRDYDIENSPEFDINSI